MREKPILFNGPMVRAILEGRKMQTRRPINFDTVHNREQSRRCFGPDGYDTVGRKGIERIPWTEGSIRHLLVCSFGKFGDRLWVRENFQPLLRDGFDFRDANYKTGYGYEISYPASSGRNEFFDIANDEAFCDRIKPSIHMPRWASRITLEITDVRVQRVQEISEEDAQAEGVERWVIGEGWREYGLSPAEELTVGPPMPTARDSFRTLWASVAEPSFKWEANPWVWAVSFMRILP